MISVEEARTRILNVVRRLPAETKPLAEALGQVLAEDVVSPITVPPLDNTAMDGYAVRAADTQGASAAAPISLRVIGEVAAGYLFRGEVTPGAAVRIMTGAPIPRGADAILASKVKLGADASAAAGPKGRTAQANTDVTMRAEVLTYSRARGLFAGISLEGSTVRPDGDANKHVYGRRVKAREIIRWGKVGVPAAGQELVSLLNKTSPKNLSDPKSLQ